MDLETRNFARFAALPERDLRNEGLVVAEGRLVAERLLLAPGFEVLGLLAVPALVPHFERLVQGRCPLAVLPEPDIARIVGYPFHRGVLALAKRPPTALGEEHIAGFAAEDGDFLVLPETRDPENLGALIRSAAALGFSGVFLGPPSADPLSRRALRVSMGASLVLPFARIEGPRALHPFRAGGYRLVAAALSERSRRVDEWLPPARCLLALGEEYGGLSPAWLAASDDVVSIPMAGGVDSLNVAAAGAIIMQRVYGAGKA